MRSREFFNFFGRAQAVGEKTEIVALRSPLLFNVGIAFVQLFCVLSLSQYPLIFSLNIYHGEDESIRWKSVLQDHR